MKVLVAFDKFKDCLTAGEACATAAQAIQCLHPEWEVESCPLTDGGEGFCEILTHAAGGRLLPVRALDARFREIAAQIGIVPVESLPAEVARLLNIPDGAASIAIVEMAQASGLEQLAADDRDPWEASSCGTGQLLREACQTDAGLILLGIGGSATNDLGLGALEALGAEFLAEGGSLPRITPKQFSVITGIDFHSNFLPLPEIRIACDVDNPLLGPNGATVTYGPQKGLTEEDLPALEEAVDSAAKLVCKIVGAEPEVLDLPGAGAAGGIGLSLHLVCGAEFVQGFKLVSGWLELKRKIQDADLVLTGEGRLDASSMHGKGPWAVIQIAASADRPVHAFAGSLAEEVLATLPPRAQAHAITPDGKTLHDALAEGPQLLGASIVRHL